MGKIFKITLGLIITFFLIMQLSNKPTEYSNYEYNESNYLDNNSNLKEESN